MPLAAFDAKRPKRLAVLKLKPDSSDARFVAKDQLGNTEQTKSAGATRVEVKQGRGPARRCSAVLIVGEETEVLRRYARSCSAYGYVVDLAADGDTAARLAGEREFDVVVSDIGKNGSGCESLHRLREQHKGVPVVVLSSGLAFASARAAVDCGAHKFLLKPVSDERLLEVLVGAMRDGSSRSGS